jgi:ABC-type ATPase involved in cell division
VDNRQAVITSRVIPDAFTDQIKGWFDLPFNGTSTFYCWSKPKVEKFSLGLLIGPSGSGKSLLLKEFGSEETITWDTDKAVVSHFSNPLDAVNLLMAVGFNDVRSFVKPYHVLSTGERFRADLARKLKDGCVIDEFTSVVDRNVAKAASVALKRHVVKAGLKNVVLATCHRDILGWLSPDWYFDTTDGTLHDGRLLRRPPITVRLYPCRRNIWKMFAHHHYLSTALNNNARCFLVTADLEGCQNIAGFVSCIPLPSGTLRHAWREHRTVVLPDFQGLGIGPCASDAIAQLHLIEGKRYFSRTTHPRFGAYRNRPNSGWMPTTNKTKVARTDIGFKFFGGDNRLAFSHEYIGKF